MVVKVSPITVLPHSRHRPADSTSQKIFVHDLQTNQCDPFAINPTLVTILQRREHYGITAAVAPRVVLIPMLVHPFKREVIFFIFLSRSS